MTNVTKVTVDLGEKSYDILIGEKILGEAVHFIADSEKFTDKVLVVTDENVIENCGVELLAAFESREIPFAVATISAGETSKNLREAEMLYTGAIEMGLDRNSVIIALGGGVVGDLAGFVAATYLRGIPFVQVPTSLLAQVDSSVGGKTAVNHELGKNLIGAFHQPKAVFIDLDVLKTLPDREIKSGLAEVIKYGVIRDANFFSYLEENVDKILSRDVNALTKIIQRSCEIKAEIVSKDEKESNLRRILNFGHTVAHAVEEETDFVRYHHGEAVAIGMLASALISEALGKINYYDVRRLKNLLERFGLDTYCEGCNIEKLYAATLRDKKTLDGKTHWVLMKKFGEVEVVDEVPEDIVKGVLKEIVR